MNRTRLRHVSISPPGTLCFFQEVLANHIAGVPAPKTAPDAPAPVQALAQAKIDTRAVKMFLYGSLVSAPMQHSLYSLLQKAFAGKTSTQAKIGQILASNLLVAPIQTSGESHFYRMNLL